MPAPDALPREGLSWQELCESPHFALLDGLPFKVETNRWGQIVLSPTRLQHSFFQKRIIRRLDDLVGEDGEAFPAISVETAEGVKVPDIGWFTHVHWAAVRGAFATPTAPEICVEVLSPWDAWGEIQEKTRLYLTAGADEVWVCDVAGRIRFFDASGELPRSPRVPAFPLTIEPSPTCTPTSSPPRTIARRPTTRRTPGPTRPCPPTSPRRTSTSRAAPTPRSATRP